MLIAAEPFSAFLLSVEAQARALVGLTDLPGWSSIWQAIRATMFLRAGNRGGVFALFKPPILQSPIRRLLHPTRPAAIERRESAGRPGLRQLRIELRTASRPSL